MNIKKLRIDRARWGKERLLDSETGKMCCLGFMGIACGLSSKTITDKDMPSSLSGVAMSRYPKAFRNGNSADIAATINDDRNISHALRESKLKKLFKENGIALTFHGKRTR